MRQNLKFELRYKNYLNQMSERYMDEYTTR